MKSELLYISPKVLDWHVNIQASRIYHASEWKRAYEYWSHAQGRIGEGKSDLDLVDVVTSLNRAVSHRMKWLNKQYEFKRIPVANKPDQIIDILEHFGIIRPVMLRNLASIRNAVEHQFVAPPTLQECRDLIEFVWYFLRSTDSVAGRVITELFLTPEDDAVGRDEGLEVRLGPDNEWKLRVGGWISSSYLLAVDTENRLQVRTSQNQRWSELRELIDEKDDTRWFHAGRSDDDVHFVGEIVGPGNLMNELIYLYFSTI